MAFTAAQKKQIDRLPQGHEYDLEKLEKLNPDQLRARVNVIGVAWGATPVVNYAAENNYSVVEMARIGRGLEAGDKWAYRMAELVAGPDIEERVAKLEGR